MHVKPPTKAQAQTQAKKSFQWGISSSTIDFMQKDEIKAARDGCGGNDCSAISTLPVPRSKPLERSEGQE